MHTAIIVIIIIYMYLHILVYDSFLSVSTIRHSVRDKMFRSPLYYIFIDGNLSHTAFIFACALSFLTLTLF